MPRQREDSDIEESRERRAGASRYRPALSRHRLPFPHRLLSAWARRTEAPSAAGQEVLGISERGELATGLQLATKHIDAGICCIKCKRKGSGGTRKTRLVLDVYFGENCHHGGEGGGAFRSGNPLRNKILQRTAENVIFSC